MHLKLIQFHIQLAAPASDQQNLEYDPASISQLGIPASRESYIHNMALLGKGRIRFVSFWEEVDRLLFLFAE